MYKPIEWASGGRTNGTPEGAIGLAGAIRDARRQVRLAGRASSEHAKSALAMINRAPTRQ